MTFINGHYIHNNNDTIIQKINVIGDENGYRYTYVPSDKPVENIKQVVQCLPCFIVDFSWSMYNSNSAKPTYDALITVCEELFAKSIDKIILVFFGGTAKLIEVTSANLRKQVDSALAYYFTSSDNFNIYGTFKASSTKPEVAFETLGTYLANIKNTNAYITFLTDGEFHGNGTPNYYINKWSNIGVDMNRENSAKIANIYTIGYQNDHLQNIKDMKAGFDVSNILFTYSTIKYPAEILNTMKEALSYIEIKSISYVEFIDGIKLYEDDTIYSKNKYFDTIVDHEATVNTNGVSAEWITNVTQLEIDIGLKEQELTDAVSQASKSAKPKDNYKRAIESFMTYHTELQQKYLTLRSKYKSLKSRNIHQLKLLMEKLGNFMESFNNVQELVKTELNDKKAFEIATKISNNISSRHLRTLQRRRIQNEQKVQVVHTSTVEIQTENPLVIVNTYNENKTTKDLSSNLDQLNEYYSCLV